MRPSAALLPPWKGTAAPASKATAMDKRLKETKTRSWQALQ